MPNGIQERPAKSIQEIFGLERPSIESIFGLPEKPKRILQPPPKVFTIKDLEERNLAREETERVDRAERRAEFSELLRDPSKRPLAALSIPLRLVGTAIEALPSGDMTKSTGRTPGELIAEKLRPLLVKKGKPESVIKFELGITQFLADVFSDPLIFLTGPNMVKPGFGITRLAPKLTGRQLVRLNKRLANEISLKARQQFKSIDDFLGSLSPEARQRFIAEEISKGIEEVFTNQLVIRKSFIQENPPEVNNIIFGAVEESQKRKIITPDELINSTRRYEKLTVEESITTLSEIDIEFLRKLAGFPDFPTLKTSRQLALEKTGLKKVVGEKEFEALKRGKSIISNEPPPIKNPTKITEEIVNQADPKTKLTVNEFFDMDELPEFGEALTVQRQPGPFQRFAEFVGFISRGRVIQKAGKPGEVLAAEVQELLRRPRFKAGEFNAALDDVLARNPFDDNDIFNLKESLEGRATPTNKVRPAFELIDQERKLVFKLAKLTDPKFVGIENHFHHAIPSADELASRSFLVGPVKLTPLAEEIASDMVRRGSSSDIESARKFIGSYVKWIDGKIDMPEDLINHLVFKGEAKNKRDAVAKLKQFLSRQKAFKFGPFEAREVNLPIYDPNPLRVFPKYVEGAYTKIFADERFGKNGEKLWDLIQKIDEIRGEWIPSRDSLTEVLGRTTLRTLQREENKKVANAFIQAQIIQKMSFSAIPNFFQGFLGSGLATSMKTAFKTKLFLRKNLEQARRWAAEVGIRPESSALFIEQPGNIAKRFLRRVGFTKTEVNNYVFATTAGRIFAEDSFRLLKRKPISTTARFRLKRLGLDPDRLLLQESLSPTDLKIASEVIWREGQAIPNILNQPERWLGVSTTSGAGRVFFQFKSVAFNQTRLVWERAIKDAFLRGRPGGLITLMTLFPAVGEIIQTTKGLLTGRERPDTFWFRYFDNMSAAFAFGLLNDLYYYSKFGILGAFGPTINQASDIIEIPTKPGVAKRQIKNFPVAGPFLYKKSIEKQDLIIRP